MKFGAWVVEIIAGSRVDKMVFTSQTHLLLLYLMYYSGNMFRLAIELSSGPYIKIQIFNLL